MATVESTVIPAPAALTPLEPGWFDTHIKREYVWPIALPDRITMRVLMRPIGLDVIDDLIASGDLHSSYRDTIPTFVLGHSQIEWTPELGSCSPALAGDKPLEPPKPPPDDGFESLVIGDAWEFASPEKDPYSSDHAPDDPVCNLDNDYIVFGVGEAAIYQLEAGLCGHHTAMQPLYRDVASGTTLRVRLRHGAILAEGEIWRLRIAIGDPPDVVWERKITTPQIAAGQYSDEVVAPRDLAAGEPLYYSVTRGSVADPTFLVWPVEHGGLFFWLDGVEAKKASKE